MESLKIRTISPVVNADPFSKVDYHIIAELKQFDIVTQNYQVVYYKEIPNDQIPEEVRPSDGSGQLERVHFFPSLSMPAASVNYMLGPVLQVDFNANGTILENIQTAMHEIFRLKVGSDGRYGLSADKWEKMYNNVPESRLNMISIISPFNTVPEGTITISTLIENSFNTTKVEFYEGTNLLGEGLNPLDQFTWENVQPGIYDLTAKLFDSNSLVNTSAIMSVVVEALPKTIEISNLFAGDVVTEGDITIQTNIAYSHNTTKVEFYEGANLLGSNSVAPFNDFIWVDAPVGSYALTAKLYDTDILEATTSVINITVEALPKTIEILNPIQDQVLTPGDVIINVSIENSDNTTKVEYYEGENLLGTNLVAPFDQFTWVDAPVGSYTLTAKLYDTDILEATTMPIMIEVQ